MASQATQETNSGLDPQITNSAIYTEIAQRAAEDKPLPATSALGAVAASRCPNSSSRKEMEAAIRAQDEGLVAGNFGTVWYRPVEVAGIQFKLEPLQPSIGTVVHGLDLAKDLEEPEIVKFLRDLWLDRHVIAFRDQSHLDRTDMVNYVKKFGVVGLPYGEKDHIPNTRSELAAQIDVDDEPKMLLLGSDSKVPSAASGWHADATWQRKPPMASVLMCREAPPVGGDTCFCDCHSMWEGLADDVKEEVKNLKTVHIGSIIHQMDGKFPVSIHPVARTHPETGQTSLYVQQGFVKRFADEHDIPEEQQRQWLWQMKLLEGRPEYTCRLHWEPGTMAMWDNRSVLHSASGDFWPYERFMERLTILDFDESRRAPYYDPEQPLIQFAP